MTLRVSAKSDPGRVWPEFCPDWHARGRPQLGSTNSRHSTLRSQNRVRLGLAFPACVLARQSKKRHHVRIAQNAPRLYHPEIDTILPPAIWVRSSRDL